MLVTECCFNENLQKFLQKSRVIDNYATPESRYVSITSTLSSRQLLKFGADVASGMAHLSNLKVH